MITSEGSRARGLRPGLGLLPWFPRSRKWFFKPMVLQASEIPASEMPAGSIPSGPIPGGPKPVPDGPAARRGSPVRRSLLSAQEADRLAAGPRLLGIRAPVLLAIFVISLMIPAAFRLGSFRITPYTALLIVFFLPLIQTFRQDRTNRLVALDFCMLAHVCWVAIAVIHAEGLGRIVFIVNTAISQMGGYMIARVLIRDSRDYERFFRTYILCLTFYMPFVMLEFVTGKVPINQILGIFMEAIPRYEQGLRLGLHRSQGFTEHPITYGLFCSIGVANLFYIYRGRLVTQLSRTGTAVFMTLMSLSSAPSMAVALQLGLIGWDRVTVGLRNRWPLLAVLIGAPLLVGQIALPHGLVGFVIDNISYNPVTGWARTEIFQYGFAEAMRHPFFGIGFGEWIRPWWRGPSVDNFWLLMAMRYGFPALLLLWLGIAIHVIQILSRQGMPDRVARCRTGYVIALVGVVFVLCTVHIWGSTAIFIMTYIGAGAWLYTGRETVAPVRPKRVGELEATGAEARAAALAGPVRAAETASRLRAGRTAPLQTVQAAPIPATPEKAAPDKATSVQTTSRQAGAPRAAPPRISDAPARAGVRTTRGTETGHLP